MVRSRLPVPSLLRLFGAFLMLFPQLLTGVPDRIIDVPVTDPRVQRILPFAVEKYNQYREKTANYFKQLRLFEAEAQVQGDTGQVRKFELTVELVKTTCKKEAGKIRKYQSIQRCKHLPGKKQRKMCLLLVMLKPSSVLYEMVFVNAKCL